MSDRLREAISCRDGRGRIGGRPCREHEDVVIDAARRFLALAETGPDYEAAALAWLGADPPEDYPGGQNGWDALVNACIDQTIKPVVDAALADYLTEEET